MAKQSVSVHGLDKAAVDVVLSSHVHVNGPGTTVAWLKVIAKSTFLLH